MLASVTPAQCLGVDASHICFAESLAIAKPIHHLVGTPFLALQKKARCAGFDMQIVSGFRDYQRQLTIWQSKAKGQRAVLDAHGNPLDIQQLSPQDLLANMMRWSALPGASRHHWGCDMDIYDAAAVDGDYQVQLTPDEVEDDGPFRAFHDWLDEQIDAGQSYGFFKPYRYYTGGIAVERWHISHAPTAIAFQQKLSTQALLQQWSLDQLCLLDVIKEQLPQLWQQYIRVEQRMYPEQYQHLFSSYQMLSLE